MMARLFALLLMMTSPAFAEMELVAAGIYCPDDSVGERIDAPDTDAGFVTTRRRGAFDFVVQDVPMIEDLGFGIEVIFTGAMPRRAKVFVTHPPMGSDGITRQSWTTSLRPGMASKQSYIFDYPHEFVAGLWTIGFAAEGRTLLTVPFTVLDPSDARVQDICAGIPIS